MLLVSSRQTRRNKKGQGIIEVVMICTFAMVPVALFFLDALAVISAQQLNESLALSAARAAASQPDPQSIPAGDPRGAAQKIVDQFPVSPLITKVKMEDCNYNPNGDNMTYRYSGRRGPSSSFTLGNVVTVKTQMSIQLPVPLPMIASGLSLFAESTQPITGDKPKAATTNYVGNWHGWSGAAG